MKGDGHEDFPGRNVVARVPVVDRSGEERVERRFEPVHEVPREVIVGRVAGAYRSVQRSRQGRSLVRSRGVPGSAMIVG